jgi:preprotein translocase subunit SecA
MNKQRESIYALRREILDGRIRVDETTVVGSREYLMELAEDTLDTFVENYAPVEGDLEQWDLPALRREVEDTFAVDTGSLDFTGKTADDIRDELWELLVASYTEKENLVGREILQRVERDIMLQVVDQQWKDHLYSLDHLKEGIGLRQYGQRDPLVEYKKESFQMFQAMKDRIDLETVSYLWRLRPVLQEEAAPAPPPVIRQAPRQPVILNNPAAETQAASIFNSAPSSSAVAALPHAAPQPARVGGDDADVKTVRHDGPKVGRNDPCPCGSGKKYKKCHGAAV